MKSTTFVSKIAAEANKKLRTMPIFKNKDMEFRPYRRSKFEGFDCRADEKKIYKDDKNC